MREIAGAVWTIVESTRLAKSTFLKNFLSKRFPTYQFFYEHFSLSAKDPRRKITLNSISKKPDGIIAELKSLTEDSLRTFDQFIKEFKKFPIIMVLTPSGYQLLNRKRKRILDGVMIVLSETKSLDYLIQIPRFMEEIVRRKRLLFQNERLKKMAEKHPLGIEMPSFSGKKLVPKLFFKTSTKSQASRQTGLRIHCLEWRSIKRKIGSAGESEISATVSRTIHGAVRNTDRVLHSAEDEFLVFLSQADSELVNRCKQRLEHALNKVTLKANNRPVKFPFAISTLE